MKKIILSFLLFLLLSIGASARFIIDTYFCSQPSPGCYEFFVVISFDNDDGEGPIYQASGYCNVGDCPQGFVVPQPNDPHVVIDLADAMKIPEVHDQFVAFVNAKGIDSSTVPNSMDISVFCNPEKGIVIVAREAQTVDKVEIRNTQGVVMKVFSAELSKLSEQYDISDLQNGIYVVSVGKNQVTIHTDQVIKN